MKKRNVDEIFSTPFCRAYWRSAFSELKDIRMLVIAAVVLAARITVGRLNPLYILPNLKINLSFWIVAAGAMIYGPVMGAFAGAVSDTVSCALNGFKGYFFPFIFVEMLGGFLSGIILYRRRLSTGRVIASRVAVNVGCNLIVNPLVMILWNWYLKTGSTYTLYTLVLTLFKNLLLLPLESFILVVFISAITPALKSMGYISKNQPKIYMKKSNYIALAVLLVLSVVLVVLLKTTGFYDLVKGFLKVHLG